jgi:hypothetical protein
MNKQISLALISSIFVAIGIWGYFFPSFGFKTLFLILGYIGLILSLGTSLGSFKILLIKLIPILLFMIIMWSPYPSNDCSSSECNAIVRLSATVGTLVAIAYATVLVIVTGITRAFKKSS